MFAPKTIGGQERELTEEELQEFNQVPQPVDSSDDEPVLDALGDPAAPEVDSGSGT